MWRHTYLVSRLAPRLLLFGSLWLFLLGIVCALLWISLYFDAERDKPRLTGLHSVLRFNPGLGMVPLVDRKTRLLHVNTASPFSFTRLTDQLSAFLSRYVQHYEGGMRNDCSNDQLFLSERRTCFFDINAGGPCSLQDGFGFYRGEPCVALKLNNIFGWLPDPVDKTKKGVLVKCAGRSPIDQELLGPVCYYDLRWYERYVSNGSIVGGFKDFLRVNDQACFNSASYGQFDSMFYPYINQANYHQPLVFVKFPRVTRYTIIRIKCWLEAKNIQVNIAQSEGSLTFTLLVD
ncbi:ATPase, Na K transporting, beta [Cichlidogyrus casuarinus]|uniref:ATPase, Na K transporting, beta n=1 Tax=Cichlidogyrus casuarinus TaxID=1844966 RepID=A0ABD2QNU9_9PLAT